MKQALLVLLLLGVLVTRGIAADTDPVDMVRNPAAYNGRYVSVSGAMMNVRPATVGGIALPTATVFDLVAGPAILG